MTGPLLQGLPPIMDDNARMLILGNMPSVMSLAARQYYANPRNGFWRIPRLPDSVIRHVVNDFESFFDTHPAIERVFFNGAAAEKNFGRLARVDRLLRYRRVPSTSPAQTMRYSDKLAAWREAMS